MWVDLDFGYTEEVDFDIVHTEEVDLDFGRFEG